ncbi:MAG: methyltransferase domain-containing protein [Actinophytocola sp.]|nr:methyltransferase domain-containing protein [Actinophytocola sp.]
MRSADIDYDYWVTAAGGGSALRGTDPVTVDAVLWLLGLGRGMRVLEIGTGSGYTAALLARGVGPSGQVVSLDHDDSLVRRAVALHDQVGNGNVEVHTAGYSTLMSGVLGPDRQ